MAPGTGKFGVRRVPRGLDRSRVRGAQNVRIVALNGGFPGRIPKLQKSEDPYGKRIPRLLTKRRFWAYGTANSPGV